MTEFFIQLALVLSFIDLMLLICGGKSVIGWILDKLGL